MDIRKSFNYIRNFNTLPRDEKAVAGVGLGLGILAIGLITGLATTFGASHEWITTITQIAIPLGNAVTLGVVGSNMGGTNS